MSQYLMKRAGQIIEKILATLDQESISDSVRETLSEVLAQELKKSFKAGADTERRKSSSRQSS